MKWKIITSIISTILFAVLIILINNYDVAQIGPNGTSVGFSHLNQAFHDFTGVNMVLYYITDYIYYISFGIAVIFACTGFIQLIKRRKLFDVDHEILILGVFYSIIIFSYFFFENVIINYRPILMPGCTETEASFPSSHTFVVCLLMSSAAMLIDKYIHSPKAAKILKYACIVCIIITIPSRLFSGVHWLTDIIGGILYILILLPAFSAAISKVTYNNND